MTALACLALTIGLLLYIFTPSRDYDTGAEKTRLAYLQERKEAVYENLRDLNFEYNAGKFPESDYLTMRGSLEDEAAAILGEIERLEKAKAG
ncbi:MAG TPA: hypothetical protein VEG30_18835 [Terriglobales bacterium]|nr:hypothetical protein [Terriglobales bacterium]